MPEYHDPNLHYTVHLIILHPAGPRVLMLSGDGGWRLPCFVAEEHEYSTVEHINAEIRNRFGWETTVLRLVHRHVEGTEQRVGNAIAAVEIHGPLGATPLDARWVGRADLAGHSLAISEHRASIGGWLEADEDGSAPPERAAWARRGWYQEAAR